MITYREFTKDIDNIGNERIRIKLTINKGKLNDLVFQYESWINGIWKEIVRYDISHGFFHRDFIYPNGEQEKTKINIIDLKTAATYAEQDIESHWQFYKNKYLKRT